MRKLKKAAALLLVLALVLSLAACGGNELAGTWEGRVDMTEMITEMVDAAMSGFEAMISSGAQLPKLADYIDSVSYGYSFTFNEDGSYSSIVDQASLQEAVAALKVSVGEYYRALFVLMLSETAIQMGLAEEINGEAELEALLGVSLDEAIAEALGMDLQSFVDSVMDSSIEAAMAEESFSSSGKYEAKDGKLYLSEGENGQIFPELYDLYSIEGGTLTITAGPAGISSQMSQFYPLVLEKTA